jgi:hypothetical protein
MEAAGRDIDLHMAEKFPLGSQRRPCPPRDFEAEASAFGPAKMHL